MSILVAYDTRYETTREVAEAVAWTLAAAGLSTSLRLAREVQELSSYECIVLGAPLYFFHMHSAARGFLARYETELASKRVAIFALGPLNDVPDDWHGARSQLEKDLARFERLTPVAKAVFGGAFKPDGLRFPLSLIPAIRHLPAGDLRDWNAIRDWAHDLTRVFLGLEGRR